MFDILIRHGLIIDGTGNPGFFGTIGIQNDVITVFRGDTSQITTKHTLDASAKVVCPGFIDVHAHSALVILDQPDHKPKVHQGITTELIGVDGNSYAPFASQKELAKFIEINSGLDGDPTLNDKWDSVSQYLSVYDKKVSVNIAYLVGNSPLRIGSVGWDNRPTSKQELLKMKSLLRESMEDGAFGMSTGLDYPPGSYADTDELVVLATEVARSGGIYHTHVRNLLGDRHLDPFKEAIDIGRHSGAPVHITHLAHGKASAGRAEPIIEMVESARNQGLDVTFDDFPYPYGGTRALVVLPTWTHEGGPENLKAILGSRQGREQLRREIQPQGQGWADMRLTYFKKAHNKRFEGKSMAEVAESQGKHQVDALCDLLLDEDLRVSYIADVVDDTTLRNIITHPLYMVGTDAILLGEFPSPTAYGAYPFILSQIVREEKRLHLAEAIRKMTSYPAQRLGLEDRGILRTGMKADIVIFDPETVNAHSTRDHPKQYSTGIQHVIVNGIPVIDQGHHTGALPGRALHRGAIFRV